MRLRSLGPLVLAVASASAAVPALAQGSLIDEGTFVVARKGAPSQTESFKIVHLDNGLIQATAQLTTQDQRISSSLVVDSIGTPMSYGFRLRAPTGPTLDINAVAAGHRLSIKSSDNRGNETMKDFQITPGSTIILDDDLLHQLYFVALGGRRTGELRAVQPRLVRLESFGLTGRGLDRIDVGGKSVTATHYSLVNGATAREFWVDAAGRVLRVEIPARGLTATRDELPR